MAEVYDINGYTLLRKIGEGGFGRVYLAQKGGKFFAVKILDCAKASREINALKKYKKLSEKNSRSLVEIFDFGEIGGRFFYLMPLADALYPNIPAESPKWQEKTLANLILQKLEKPNEQWFSPEEIAEIILPIIDAADFLSQNGLVHRDIKPSNILFFGGKPVLSDFGLLSDERPEYSSAVGTPSFAAPQWFLNSGGNPDFYGIVATFYMLISGNYPERMGNPNFLMPQSVKNSADPQLKARYNHWNRVILRALADKPNERFLNFGSLKAAIAENDFEKSLAWNFKGAQTPRKSRLKKIIPALLAAALIIFAPILALKLSRPDAESFLIGKDHDFISAFKNGKALPQPYTIMSYEEYAKSSLHDHYKNLQKTKRKFLESNQLSGKEKEKALRFVKKNSLELYQDYYNSQILTYEYNRENARRNAEIKRLNWNLNALEDSGRWDPDGMKTELSIQDKYIMAELHREIENLRDVQNKEREKFLEQLKEYNPQ